MLLTCKKSACDFCFCICKALCFFDVDYLRSGFTGKTPLFVKKRWMIHMCNLPLTYHFCLKFSVWIFSIEFPMEKKKQNSEDSWMYPYQRTPKGNPYIMGYDPQESLESLENTINTMSTLLGVHQIVH